MRIFTLFLLVFYAHIGFCQLAEDFNQGDDFTARWLGSNGSSDFRIENGMLRSASTLVNSRFYVSTRNQMAKECTWEFICTLRFNPSGLNFVDVYLVSDKEDLLAQNITGYFIRIGGTDDDICLYKRTGLLSKIVKIFDGPNGILNKSVNTLKLNISRDSLGVFKISERNGLFESAVAADASVMETAWFGIVVQQSTASFFQKHYFDDLFIKSIERDTIPPRIKSVVPIDTNVLSVSFSEEMDDASTWLASHFVMNAISPDSVRKASSKSYHLFFSKGFTSGQLTLHVSGLQDKSGNFIPAHTSFTFKYVRPYLSRFRDVVINEIFADPSPVVGLPPAEFVEIVNTTNEHILLKGWKYGDATTVHTFLADTLAPNEYLILCASADTAVFQTYGRTIGLAKWPSLNNDSDRIFLNNERNEEIDRVTYSVHWYKDAKKQNGGFSLEQLDPANICQGIQNWKASTDAAGGTPGRVNSVYRHQLVDEPLRFEQLAVLDSVTILLTFNKYIDSAQASKVDRFQFNNGIGLPRSALPIGPEFKSIRLTLNVPIRRGVESELILSGIADCAGNFSVPQTQSIFLAEHIQPGDVLISEILFDPKLGGADFVEIYNASKKKIDLMTLQVLHADKGNHLPAFRPPIYMMPHTYFVLTSDPQAIIGQYNTRGISNFLSMKLPAFGVTSGSVTLHANGLEIDKLEYRKEMHHPLFRTVKGVSLERTSFSRPAQAAGNFVSASALQGFATPGYENSMKRSEHLIAGLRIYLPERIFVPGQDGELQRLKIKYEVPEGGKIGSLIIYNDQGILVRKLFQNYNLGSDGYVYWDGRSDQGMQLRTGIYLLRLQVFDLSGKLEAVTATCVLANFVR